MSKVIEWQEQEQTPSSPDLDEIGTPTDNRVRAILEQVPEGGSVLDVGCVQHDADKEADPNWLHQHLYARADEVLGIDFLEDEISELAKQGYNVTYGNAENLMLPGRFDAIVAGELIEHLSCPGAFLDGAREHLHDDGKLILSTPNGWGAAYLKRLLFPGEIHCNTEHVCWYDRRTLRQLLERHGFDAEIQFVRPSTETTPTPAPRLCWRAGSQRLGANELLAIATPADE